MLLETGHFSARGPGVLAPQLSVPLPLIWVLTVCVTFNDTKVFVCLFLIFKFIYFYFYFFGCVGSSLLCMGFL